MLLRKTSLLLLSLLFIGFTSCHKGNVVPGKGINLVLSAVEQQQVTPTNAFTFKLFKNLDSANTGGANLFISPLSVGFAIGMTSNGAAGQTLTAIDNTMDFTGYSQAQVNTYYNDLITQLPKLDPNSTVNIANSIWYEQGFSVLPQFLQTNTTYYHANVQSLDFTSSSAATTINNWVNQETDGKIPAIVNQIPNGVIMYLINAMYFKSSWNEKFDVSKTAPLPFYLPDNSQVQANFMDGTIDYNRYGDNEAYVYELPYIDKKYSMVIVMPATGTSVNQLIASIDSAKWKTWMTGLEPANSELKVPKFTFSYTVDLSTPLKQLGMGIAFSGNADFSGINATFPLQITDVLHKAYIDVDESGTTAAAATSVSVGVSAVAQQPPTVIDHPFLLAIREMSSGLILFTGVVNNPTLTGN